MSDIFDEVDDILSDVDSEFAENATDNNFNESELQDIMDEIESLEKEFENEGSEITPEVKMSSKVINKSIMAASKVLSFDKAASSEISFEAHGQMNLNLSFKIGDESARLTIDPVKGLVVIMSGVELCINQMDGCKVTMDSGVTFTIPLTSSETTPKKKSA